LFLLSNTHFLFLPSYFHYLPYLTLLYLTSPYLTFPGECDPLGVVVVPIGELAVDDDRAADGSVSSVSRAYTLQNVKHGTVTVSLRLTPAPAASRMPKLSRCFLDVTVHGAVNLRAADVGGSSDPFCEVSVRDKVYKTDICKKTLKPEWNSAFKFKVNNVAEEQLSLRVFDWDR
jgi:hypothetical protein